jgi:hypothetical protein
MAAAIHPVFWVGALVCALALVVSFFLPADPRDDALQHRTDPSSGEKMLMAEQTTINARNQPVAESGNL